MSAAPSAWAVAKAMSAAAQVRAKLLAIDPAYTDDNDLIADTLDGETDALEVVRRLIRYSLEQRSLADAAEARARDIKLRQARFEAREQAARAVVTDMLDALGVHRVQAEDFSVSLKLAPPKVLITDEQLLADEFVRIQRSPDRTAIGRAIDEGREVQGAVKSNVGLGFVLSVRTK
jgi:4-hydroxy-3-methylbut-2-en-1-yl diphosphate synthase IspG/GcpE